MFFHKFFVFVDIYLGDLVWQILIFQHLSCLLKLWNLIFTLFDFHITELDQNILVGIESVFKVIFIKN